MNNKEVADKLEKNLQALIRLNETIDNLIDIAHESSMIADNKENKARMEGEISAYLNIKNLVEDILYIKYVYDVSEK